MAPRLRASRGTTVFLEYELFEPINLLHLLKCLERCQGLDRIDLLHRDLGAKLARLKSQVHGDADWRDRLAAGVEAETCDKLSRKEQTNSGQHRRGGGG